MAKKKSSKQPTFLANELPANIAENEMSEPAVDGTASEYAATEEAIARLDAEVAAIAQGRELNRCVVPFITTSGAIKGASLAYYYACKRAEITAGQDCEFIQPAPMQNVSSVAYKQGTFTALGTQSKPKGKECPGCKH